MKRIYAILLVIVMSIGIIGCDKKDSEAPLDFYTNADYISVEVTNEVGIGIQLLVLTKEEVKEISVQGVNGENISINDLKIEVANGDVGLLDDCTHRGLEASLWNIDMFPTDEIDSMAVDSITLLVNDKEREIKFKNSLKFTRGDGMNNLGNMQAEIMAMEFPGNVLNGELEPYYTFNILENVEICKIYASDGIEINITELVVNGTGVEETEYPLALKKGDYVQMSLGFSSESLSERNSVMADMWIKYESEGVMDYFKNVITIDPIFPIVDNDFTPVKEYIDIIINEW